MNTTILYITLLRMSIPIPEVDFYAFKDVPKKFIGKRFLLKHKLYGKWYVVHEDFKVEKSECKVCGKWGYIRDISGFGMVYLCNKCFGNLSGRTAR